MEPDTRISLTFIPLFFASEKTILKLSTLSRVSAFLKTAMDVDEIPSEATLRLRMDKHAPLFLPIIEKASRDFLTNIQPSLEPLNTGHIPLDADVTPLDNSGSNKEGVSRTYKGHDGYAPMPAYLGQEGYCLEFELREGKQHCQKDTPALLQRVLGYAQQVTDQPVLLRLDGGNDAIENVDGCTGA